MTAGKYKYVLILRGFLVSITLLSSAHPQAWDWSQFIADTLVIQLPADSNHVDTASPIQVMDNRETPGPVLGIRQIKKWRYIPVDQYMVLEKPLAEVLGQRLPADATPPNATLVVDNVSIWYDGAPALYKGWTLNGYTRLIDNTGATIRDWQWEQRIRKKRKQKVEDVIGRLVDGWMMAQSEALNAELSPREVSPYRYRRQLMFWVDTIILPDGYILNGHLSLDFPADQLDRYIRGAPGMEIYYRKSSRHESIGVGGKQQQWLVRLRPSWLGRLSLSFRIGGNSFNPDKFDHVDWWNILLVNVGLTTAVEYHPKYHKGLFAGIGLHQSINVLPLPDIVPPYAIGLVLTVGVILP